MNWDPRLYAFERLDLGPSFRLPRGWGDLRPGHLGPMSVPLIDGGTFYIFSNINKYMTQIFTAPTRPALGRAPRCSIVASISDKVLRRLRASLCGLGR